MKIIKTTIKTGLAAVLLLAIACKKESNTLQSSRIADKSSTDVETGVTAKYVSIKIGTQKWMTTNLAVSHYRNGDKIPQVKDPAEWAGLTTGAWCWYNNDSAIGAVYGKLYNWYAVHDPRGLAPTGWHVPSYDELDTLSKFLGGKAVAGGKIKETGTTHWLAPNTGATNSSGFTALPGGYRDYSGSSAGDGIGAFGPCWTSTKSSATGAWNLGLHYDSGEFFRISHDKRFGFSVRCLRD